MAEAVLDGLFFVSSWLVYLLTPFLNRRVAGFLWLVVGAGSLWVNTLATSVKGGAPSAVILYTGYTLMMATGLLLLGNWRHCMYSVYALAVWFGVVVMRFFEAGLGWSTVVTAVLLLWQFLWDQKALRSSR